MSSQSKKRATKIYVMLALLVIVMLTCAYYFLSTDKIKYFRSSTIPENSQAIVIAELSRAQAYKKNGVLIYLQNVIDGNANTFSEFGDGLDDKSIKDYISASLTLEKKESDFVSYTFVIKLNELIERLVNLINISKGNTKAITLNTYSDNISNEYSLTTTFHPHGPITYPEEGYESIDTIKDNMSHDLAKYIFDYEIDCKERVCVNDIPTNNESLNKLIDGYDVLTKGESSFECSNNNLKDIECLNLAINYLRESIKKDQKQSMAYFGIFIAGVKKARHLVGHSRPMDLSRALISSSRAYNTAKYNSTYLKHYFETNSNVELMLSEIGIEELGLSGEFLNKFSRYEEAREAYRKYDPDRALELYREVEEVSPIWVKEDISFQVLNSKWKINKSVATVEMIEEMRTYENKIDSNKFRVMLARYLLSKNVPTNSDFVEANDLMNKAVESVTPGSDKTAIQIERSIARHMAGDTSKAKEEIEAIESIALKDKECDKRYTSAYMGMTAYYDLTGEISKARKYFEIATELDPILYPFGKTFKNMVKASGYIQWDIKVQENIKNIKEGQKKCSDI